MGRVLEFLRRQPRWRLGVLAAAVVAVLGFGSWGVVAAVGHGDGGQPLAQASVPPDSPVPSDSAPGGTAPSGGGTTAASTPPTPPTPPPSDSQIQTMEARVVTLLNARRADARCTALATDSRLATAAAGHAQDMASRGYFSHTTPEGKTFEVRISDAGYGLTNATEIIAFGQPTPEAVVEAWLASPDQRADIVDCSLRNIGVGLAYSSDSNPYWSASLAAPAA